MLRTVTQHRRWGRPVPALQALLQGGHRRSHTVAVHCVCAAYQNPAYFIQWAWKSSKASANVVIKCMITARTGILGGLVPDIIGSGEEQDYC